MRAKEYIADSTYSTWVEFIVEQLDQPMFKEILTRLRKEDAFPYEYLNNLLNGVRPTIRAECPGGVAGCGVLLVQMVCELPAS